MRTLNQTYLVPTILLIGILTFLSTPSMADGQKFKGDVKFKKGHSAHAVNNYSHGNKHHADKRPHKKHHNNHNNHNQRYSHNSHNSHHNKHHNNHHNYHAYKHYNNHNRHYYRSSHHSDRLRFLFGLHLNNLDIYLRD